MFRLVHNNQYQNNDNVISRQCVKWQLYYREQRMLVVNSNEFRKRKIIFKQLKKPLLLQTCIEVALELRSSEL